MLTCNYQGGNEYHVILDKEHIATFHCVLKRWYPHYHKQARNIFGRSLLSKEAAIAWVQMTHKQISESKQQ